MLNIHTYQTVNVQGMNKAEANHSPYFILPFIAIYLQLENIKSHKIDPLPHIYADKMCAIYAK